MLHSNSSAVWKNSDGSGPGRYDTVHSNLDNHRHKEASRAAAATHVKQQDQKLQLSESTSSVSSLYANPPSPVFSPSLDPKFCSRYTTLQDVPHQPLNNTQSCEPFYAALSYRFMTPLVPKAPFSTLQNAESQYYMPPAEQAYPPPGSLPKGAGILSNHPQVLEDSNPAESCIPTADLFRSQMEMKWSETTRVECQNTSMTRGAARETIGNSKIKSTLQVNAEVETIVDKSTRRLETPFRHRDGIENESWCSGHYDHDPCAGEAQKSEERKHLSPSPSSSRKSLIGEIEEETPATVAKGSYVAPDRFVNFVERQHAMRTAHVSEHDEKRKHEEWLKKLFERKKKLNKKCIRLHEDTLRRGLAGSTNSETRSKITPEKDMTEASTNNGTTTSQKEASRGPLSRSEARTESNPTTTKEAILVLRPEGINRSGHSHTSSKEERDGRAAKTLEITSADTLKVAKIKRESVVRLRDAVKMLVAKKEPEGQWTSIGLGDDDDDDDWEKIADDEDAEWEVVEK